MKDASGSTTYELLRQCYAMVGGIPATRFDLLAFRQPDHHSDRYMIGDYTDYQRQAELHVCGTLFCAGGYCTIYPPFVELGLHADYHSRALPQYKEWLGFTALGNFFWFI